jgi:threonine dehydrogenase-like Zn-dependent dehydrogenase
LRLFVANKKMLAGQITGPGQLNFIDLPRPQIAERQLLVKLEIASLCGSDIPYFLHDTSHPSVAGQPLPLRPGLSLHELIGTVYESKSKRFKEGDRVLALPFHYLQGMSEYFLSADSLAVPLPSGNAEQLVLSQPLGTVVHACRKLPNLLGKTAVVLGQGPIGQLFCALLRHLGAVCVITVDSLPERLRISSRMGATDVFGENAPELKAAVRDLTNGAGADLVVEAIGKEETLNLASDLIRRHGTVILFGLPNRFTFNIAIHEFFYKEAHLIGCVGPDVQDDFPIAVELIATGAIDVKPLITHKFPFLKAQDAFTLFSRRSDGAMKVILETNGQ